VGSDEDVSDAPLVVGTAIGSLRFGSATPGRSGAAAGASDVVAAAAAGTGPSGIPHELQIVFPSGLTVPQ
jgi:hypothetical protein